MTSPYKNSAIRVMAGTDIPATSQDGLRGGVIRSDGSLSLSAGPAFNNKGQLNASSKAEFLRMATALMRQTKDTSYMLPGTAAERTAALKMALSSPDLGGMQKIGTGMAGVIMDTMRRQGISRRLLREDVATGPVISVRVSPMDVVAFTATDKENITVQDVRGQWFMPPEFSIATSIEIANKDLAQIGPSFMDEKFNDGMVAQWTAEDRLTRRMLLETQGIYNTPFGFVSFTPSVLAAMRSTIVDHGLAPTTVTLSADLWTDLSSNSDFIDLYSPIEQHDLILQGQLGTLLGMEIITEPTQYANIRVLNRGEVFVTCAPATLGAIVQRTTLEAVATDQRVNSRAARGWFLEQIQAQCVVNARGVTYAVRS